MTDVLAALGLLSLLTGGELDTTMSLVIGVSMAAAVMIPERLQDHPRLRGFGVVASLSLLGVQLSRAVSGGDLLTISVEFAAALQVIRVATRRGAAHDQQIILLALLHLVAGTVLGGGLAYGLSLVGFLVIAPGSLVLSHLRREVEGNYRQGARDRTGLPVDVPRILRSRRVISQRFLLVTCSLSIPVFLFTAVLFLIFPRVGLSLLLLNHSRSARMIGFSSRVDLGGVGRLRSDPTIAMRVHLATPPTTPASRLALYLRGTSFDRYARGSWSRSVTDPRPALSGDGHVWLEGRPMGSEAMTIDLEPIEPRIVFLPADAVGFRVAQRLDGPPARTTSVRAADGDEFKYETLEDRGLRYTVFRGRRGPEHMTADERFRYLSVPSPIRPRLEALAERWTAGEGTDLQKAEAIERHLRAEYRYDLESVAGAAKEPLMSFLFDEKSGHCEFYSTAMAMLLRTLGVPTRNVTGFIGGTYNRFGDFYAVRQGDAHSWIEAYLADRGWTRFDPTPPASAAPRSEVTGMVAFVRDFVEAAAQRWSRHVVGYDLDQQIEIFRSVRERYHAWGGPALHAGAGRALPVAGVVLFGVAVLLIWRRLRIVVRRAPEEDSGPQRAAHLRVVALYRGLEDVLRGLGIPRPASSPPLAYAKALSEVGHPAASEVLALTRLYLEARFGNRDLTSEEEANFLARTKALRSRKMLPPSAA